MDASGPLVSIVVNNHNYGRYLRDAVRSAVDQTYGRVEVVVVDDGSTDGSHDILASFGSSITAVFQPNLGQAAALNAGVTASSGDLVMFLDADDLLEPDAAAAMAAAWTPGVVKVQGLVRLIDEEGRPTGARLPADPLPRGDVRGVMLRSGGYASTGTTGTAFSRECLEKLLPIPVDEWRRAPDSYLLTLAPFIGELAAIERLLGRVRIHGANKWSMQRLEIPRLIEHLEVDHLREELLRSRASALGVDVPRGWLLRSPTHLQSRLASLRLDPDRHPYRADRRLPLAWRGVRAALGHRGFTVRKRLLFALWFLAVGVLPRRLAARIIDAGYLRRRRPAWFQRFIERGAVPGTRRAG